MRPHAVRYSSAPRRNLDLVCTQMHGRPSATRRALSTRAPTRDPDEKSVVTRREADTFRAGLRKVISDGPHPMTASSRAGADRGRRRRGAVTVSSTGWAVNI